MSQSTLHTTNQAQRVLAAALLLPWLVLAHTWTSLDALVVKELLRE